MFKSVYRLFILVEIRTPRSRIVIFPYMSKKKYTPQTNHHPTWALDTAQLASTGKSREQCRLRCLSQCNKLLSIVIDIMQ